uniref:DUF1639 domain-containing protein n=1 Tax=Brassica campestris TaxID=3711 RepID=M4DWN3_BRACM
MKHSKDPFEAAIEEEQEESPQESPVSYGGVGGGGNDDGLVEIDQTPEESERDVSVRRQNKKSKTSSIIAEAKSKDEDEEEEEENMEAELTKYPTTADPAKMATMQYQRVSPDCVPLTNGANKPYLRPSPSNEDTTTSIAAGRGFNGGSCTISSSLDGVPEGFRFRSTQQHDPTPSRGGGGDVLLQWGQRKRSRISRAEIRSSTTTPADDSSSSSGQGKTQSNKLSRRSLNPSMPPPAPVFSGRSSNNRNGIVGGKEIFLSRNLEDRSANGSPSRNINSRMVSRSAGSKRSPPSPDQIEKRSSVRDHHQNHRQNGLDHNHDQQHQRVSRSESAAQAHPELETNKNNGEKEKATQVETREWPRIYIALSRKEKEEDFLVMKGTKLPHRPRKRAKNIDKSLQYCFPGMWLSDLTKNRYEVREKKNVKKQPKRRGLKGLENLDTDSE